MKARKRSNPLAHYESLVQALRYCLGKKIKLIQRVEIAEHNEPTENNSVEATVRVFNLKFSGKRVISPKAIEDFFLSWQIQEAFLLWLGRYSAATLPTSVSGKKLKRKLENLRAGRARTLPPSEIVRQDYRVLVIQFRTAKLFLKEYKNDRFEKLKRFASENRFSWVDLIEDNIISVDQIAYGLPEDNAKQVLCRRYDTSEEALHACLFRHAT